MKIKPIVLILAGILLIGCDNPKIQNIKQDQSIYKSDYKMIKQDVIKLSQLEDELKMVGIELDEFRYEDSDAEYQGYYFDLDDFNMNIYFTNEDKGSNKILNSIFIDSKQDKILWEDPFVSRIADLMDGEKIISWIREGEGKGQGFTKDIIAVGSSSVSYILDKDADYKSLSFNWSANQDVSSALGGIVAELENEEFIMQDYMKKTDGEMVYMVTPYYHLSQDHRFYDDDRERIGKTKGDAAGYRIMYDMKENKPYNVQIYGLIPVKLDSPVRIEDMPGIGSISRMLNMDLEEFGVFINSINQELTRAKELFVTTETYGYNAKGQVGDYNYELYIPNGSNWTDMYRFTVLID